MSAGASQQFAGGAAPRTTKEITIASGAPTKVTLELAVGTLVVARVRTPAGSELQTVEYTLVPGTGTFDTKALRTLAREDKAPSYLLGGGDVDRDAQFHDVKPGTYTLCIDARVDRDTPWPLVCRPLTISADRAHLEFEVDVKP